MLGTTESSMIGLDDDVAVVGNHEKVRPLCWEGASRVVVGEEALTVGSEGDGRQLGRGLLRGALEQNLRDLEIRSRSSIEVGCVAFAARALRSTTRGCRKWRRATLEDVLRAEEEQWIWLKMAATKSAGGVSSNYIDGPARRNGKSRWLTDQGKGLRGDCLQRPFNGIPWSQGILSLMVCCIFCTQRWSPSKVPDFIEEIIYTPTEVVHMTGRYVDDRQATRHKEAVLVVGREGE
ncbi:hypothetical protein B296_00047067 [Ensete ventricosum]|uniref:Uncharacterized protein n=1 Tax=Ensete ventricosum TaxID=4639 RepID=A0A426YTV8_ENSVE|nr:hypothetical protein B296_00047067 [Ensete ventricosum]